jgi:hypothetical protein
MDSTMDGDITDGQFMIEAMSETDVEFELSIRAPVERDRYTTDFSHAKLMELDLPSPLMIVCVGPSVVRIHRLLIH